MDGDKKILNTLRFGSSAEIGKAITEASRLKDPAFREALSQIKDSSDPFLSMMAAYAIGESGDQAGLKHLQQLFSDPAAMLPFVKEPQDPKLVEEIRKLPDTLKVAFGSYDRSRFEQARENFLSVLQLYSSEIPKMNVPHFDEFVQFVVAKTRGLVLDALAVCEFNLGNIEEALNHSMEAVSIAEEVGDPQLLKSAYADLGHFHICLGNYYSALELYQRSLEIDDGSYDPRRKRNRILSNLAHLYHLVGQHNTALECIEEALELSERENDLKGKAQCLNSKGVLLDNSGDFDGAESCLREALRLAKDELHEKSLQALILNNLSGVCYSISDFSKSEKYLRDALELAIEMSDKSVEGRIHCGLAMVAAESGDGDEAIRQAEFSRKLFAAIHDLAGQSEANLILGLIEDHYNDDPNKAFGYYGEAIDVSEKLRSNLMLDEFKVSFGADKINIYEQMISLCVRMGRLEDTFEYIERSKSRALVDMLSHSLDSIGPREASEDEHKEVAIHKGNLDILKSQLKALYLEGGSGEFDKERATESKETLVEELAQLEGAYQAAFQELKMKDPAWASLVSVDVISINDVQDILDSRTLLIELYQTGEETIIFAVRKDTAPSLIKIPIDVDAEAERLYGLISNLLEGKGIDTRSHDYIRGIKQPLSHFYELFITPLLDLLKDIDHLVIIPHYFWHYLPFHALYDNALKEYLIDKCSVSYAPSATALSVYMKNNSSSPPKSPSALILANPSKDLPFAEGEAERIKNRFTRSNLFKGSQASFGRLVDHGEADVIHLACHGYFRGDEPIFSHLVLADDEGKAAPVFLPDIFNLKLNAYLVTLSACETGLSQFTAGDELIGVSRAFFYAGTPSLLSSLWTVNDRSTALLMDDFYEALIGRGENKASALQCAMLALRAMPGYSNPYFWAPFFITGDWR